MLGWKLHAFQSTHMCGQWSSMGCKYFDNVYEKGYVSFLSEDFLISWVYDYLFGGNRPRMLLRMEISSIWRNVDF